MWQFLSQYGWYLFIFGMMILMHRRGMGGCCGGHQQDQNGQHHQHDIKQPIPFEQKK
ncbi:hypothetical protein Desaci_3943 [Desulfosporosinus acidiphilus SJ4]|uniref:DUF2933 domain-containing protein n=1 Tax=Desulfosporosinus acidiphilus (strain DSM 22704 / JCM 16185 / SJ4) TaxID=646529 RepID=I4DAJ1_DESAJ|nr:hypothetical protein [Desulfosporosinus acidiphilus]AFM42815.1 hypothetical protein Desaci_3943 [Desulfosporosinus acidiphilus SJ4]